MANISVSVTDGNNIAVEVTPVPTQVITIDRGIAGPVGPPGPAGSVASVALTAPALFSVAGSPITSTGTLALTYSGSALPVANGGTGLASYTANGVVYASGTGTLASGSALVFDGTKLGVGTSSPGSKVTVAGTAGTAAVGLVETGVRSWAIRAGGSATNTFDIADLTAAATRLTLDSSGNLGLGVTPSAWGAATPAYQVLRASLWGAANNAYVGANYYYDGSNRRYIGSDFATEYAQLSGQHAWYTAPSGTAGNPISFTQAMTLDASGNLLVGTSTASGGKLIVKEGATNFEVNTDSASAQILAYDRVASQYKQVVLRGNEFIFSPSDIERVRIDSSGNLNIANLTASKPVFTDASKNLTSTGTVSVVNGGTGATTLTGVLKGNGTSAFTAATAGTDYVAPGTATTFTAAQSFTASGILLKGSSTGYTTFTSANASATNYTVTVPAETMTVGYKNIPAVGTKTASYTLAVADVGKYVQVGTGGSITIPTATFAEGDIVSVFNNTAAAITITCTITTAYIAGTDADRATVSLATRGVATILFISGTVCVISGNVS